MITSKQPHRCLYCELSRVQCETCELRDRYHVEVADLQAKLVTIEALATASAKEANRLRETLIRAQTFIWNWTEETKESHVRYNNEREAALEGFKS